MNEHVANPQLEDATPPSVGLTDGATPMMAQYHGLDADGFHRTTTIDYIMLVSGEVDLILDEGRTTVRAGDLVVQRNTNHAWHNMGDVPVDFWGVMMSLLPR